MYHDTVASSNKHSWYCGVLLTVRPHGRCMLPALHEHFEVDLHHSMQLVVVLKK